MIFFYSHIITNRLRYIVNHIFGNFMGVPYRISSDKDEFIQYQGAKINYSNVQFDNELFFYASPLLFERGIKQQHLKVESYEGTNIFFINKNNSDIPFDPFAAAFYLLSRYEEYLPTQLDHHGRFPAEQSLAYKNGFLHKPVVDIWIKILEKVLKNRFPDLVFHDRKYKFIPTYDIDIAYAYQNKGIVRTLGCYIADMYRFRWAEIRRRTQVLLGMQQDPYDTYAWQIEQKRKYKVSPIYFFLIGQYGQYDKNITIENNDYQRLIRETGDWCEVGIHPSYQSNIDEGLLAEEVENLSLLLRKEIRKSRQHYIKLTIPQTYQRLLAIDITQDYSMGYPSQVGFRAGTSSSFYFYDITLEMPTRLKVFPFAVMDVTLRDYLRLSPEQASAQLRQIVDEVRAVNGLFISIWHNSSLGETHGWEGWRAVYNDLLGYALPNQQPILLPST